MWMVVVPASYLIMDDESDRTKAVGVIAKKFGRIANISLLILVITGIYNTTWYLGSLDSLFSTFGGNLLLVKIILVGLLIIFTYLHNFFYGKKIIKFASEKRINELIAIRKKSRIVSVINILLMIAIVVLATFMQMPPL